MKFANPISVVKDESGATAIEYGLIAALISVFAIAALKATGVALEGVFQKVTSDLNDAL